MSKHSDKGPSSSDRWIHCTPSVKLCADMKETASDFAQEGTDAHALCEYYLKKAFGIPCENPIENLTFYNAQMDEAAQDYVNYVLELYEEAKKKCKDPVVLVEQQIQYERFVPGGFGTSDCVIIADGTMIVVDFKYGMGVLVKAEGNSQMMIYALGSLESFDAIYDIHDVKMTIFQPRLSNISVAEMSRDDLYKWAEEVLKPKAIEAEEGTGEFSTGDWCRFCKARYVCRERAKKNLELAAYEFADPPLLSDEEMVDILGKVDRLVGWASDIKEYALQEAVAGKKWPGYKLVEGRAIRKYKDEATIAELVINAGEDPYEKKLKGITEMTKLLGKKKFEELLGALVIKPQGKPALVLESDPREEMSSAKNDFND